MKTLPVLAAIVIALGWSQTVLAQGASPLPAGGQILDAADVDVAAPLSGRDLVVVLTMIAAEPFEPRVIWGSGSRVRGHHG
jgi:hypothetical protein